MYNTSNQSSQPTINTSFLLYYFSVTPPNIPNPQWFGLLWGRTAFFQKLTKEPAYANHPLHVCDHADSRLYHGSKKLDLGPEICVKPAPCMRAKLLQSCPTFCDPMDCSPPGSSIHGIFQAKILECIAMPFSRASSWPRDRTYVSYVSCIGRWVLHH